MGTKPLKKRINISLPLTFIEHIDSCSSNRSGKIALDLERYYMLMGEARTRLEKLFTVEELKYIAETLRDVDINPSMFSLIAPMMARNGGGKALATKFEQVDLLELMVLINDAEAGRHEETLSKRAAAGS